VTLDGSYFVDNFAGAHHDLKFGSTANLKASSTNRTAHGEIPCFVYNSPAGADFTVAFAGADHHEPAIPHEKTWHHSFYLQDQIKLTKRLTINAGFRWDKYTGTEPDQTVRPDAPFRSFFYAGTPLIPGASTIPQLFPSAKLYPSYAIPVETVFSFKQPSSSRASAWPNDLRGDGKTVVKGNFGLFRRQPGDGAGPGRGSDPEDNVHLWLER